MSLRVCVIWVGLIAAISVPIAVAATSPLLAWRDPVYIASGFAGMIALSIVLLQPLLAGGLLPGLPVMRGRRVHRVAGLTLVGMVVAHVGGLWLTSPPDVIDALLFDSPTPFSVWGVIAMWATFAAALLAVLRSRLRIPPRFWRVGHTALALIIVLGSVAHALLVEGSMGTVSKFVLCGLVLASTAKVVFDLRAWALLVRRKG